MKYITTYYRTQEEGTPSLVLLHFLYRDASVFFGCISREDCEQEGKVTFADRVREWSQRCNWVWLTKKMRYSRESVRRYMEREFPEPEYEEDSRKHHEWVMILCVEQHFIVLGDGFPIYQIMSHCGLGKLRKMSGCRQGRMESGVGILISSKEIDEEGQRSIATTCFQANKIRQEESAGSRLKEFACMHWDEGQQVALILMLTKD